MKKAYETPMVEMIAFRYRDQVVVASGGTENSTSADNSQQINWEGGNFCKVVDVVTRGAIDWVSCYSA